MRFERTRITGATNKPTAIHLTATIATKILGVKLVIIRIPKNARRHILSLGEVHENGMVHVMNHVASANVTMDNIVTVNLF